VKEGADVGKLVSTTLGYLMHHQISFCFNEHLVEGLMESDGNPLYKVINRRLQASAELPFEERSEAFDTLQLELTASGNRVASSEFKRTVLR
jgi:hypothetical protein